MGTFTLDSVSQMIHDRPDEEPTTRTRIYELTRVYHDLDKRLADTETQRKRDHGEHSEQLNRIEDLTAKTNGRVSKLEQWRLVIVGALSVLIPLAVWLLKVWGEFESKKVLGP